MLEWNARHHVSPGYNKAASLKNISDYVDELVALKEYGDFEKEFDSIINNILRQYTIDEIPSSLSLRNHCEERKKQNVKEAKEKMSRQRVKKLGNAIEKLDRMTFMRGGTHYDSLERAYDDAIAARDAMADQVMDRVLQADCRTKIGEAKRELDRLRIDKQQPKTQHRRLAMCSLCSDHDAPSDLRPGTLLVNSDANVFRIQTTS